MKVEPENVYGVVSMPKEKFEQLNSGFFISSCTESVKYMCANDRECEHIKSLGITIGDRCFDYFKLVLSS